MIRTVVRYVLAIFYLAAGIIHVADPAPFLSIIPVWVPFPENVVFLTGIAEVLGAIGLAQPFSLTLRRAAAIGLALYAFCVFPANINHYIMDMAKPGGGLGLGYHVPRMFAQPLVIWAALWAGTAIDWPFRAKLR